MLAYYFKMGHDSVILVSTYISSLLYITLDQKTTHKEKINLHTFVYNSEGVPVKMK
jgi:hypothetical protein